MGRGLSKQEKAILDYLDRCGGSASQYQISQEIAEQFNKGQNDRIWDRHAMKTETINNLKTLKEAGDYEEYKIELGLANIEFHLVDSIHRKDQILTGKHCASVSRSLRRLQERGLILKMPASKMVYKI